MTQKTAKASSKKTAPAVPKGEIAPPKKRGRPPKGGETTKITHDDSAAAEQLEEELNEGADQPEDEEELEENPEEEAAADEEQAEEEEQEEEKEPVSPRKRKAPVPKPVASPAKSRVSKKEKTAKAAAAAEEAEASSSGRQFWLMKAEQESREETTVSGKSFDTKFTIDDLRAKGGPEPWDGELQRRLFCMHGPRLLTSPTGVRNAVAAKNMRAMKKGDLAFFYASGGKAGRKPGIVGIMEVVREHEPDASTADKEHYAYVEKEADRARWCVVHVEYRKKLSKPVHLSVLQEHAKDGGPLSNIELLRLARLSVSRVSEREWDFITENLIEGYEHEIDSFDAAKASDGQEKDVPPSIFGPTVSAITEKVTDALHDVAAAVLPERDLLSPEPLTAGISSPLPQV